MRTVGCLQAVHYFMEPARLQNPSYFWRLLDIIKAPEGKELLDQLTQSVDLIVRVFTHQPDPSQDELVKVGAHSGLRSFCCARQADGAGIHLPHRRCL